MRPTKYPKAIWRNVRSPRAASPGTEITVNAHVIRPWLLFDVQAVAEPGAPARQDGDAQARRFLGDLLFGQELLDLFARPFGERQGNRPLCSAHSYPPIWQQLRQSRRPCQP